MLKLSRSKSLIIVAAVYIAAFFIGMFVFNTVPVSTLLAFFIADIAATIVVWFFGIVFRNASMYDPYWSIAPIVLFTCFVILSQNIDAVGILYLIVFSIWGLRLTLNWITDWTGMVHQDWRYTMLRQQNPKLWLLTNLFGINIMPTLFVFSGLLPAYFCTLTITHANLFSYLGASLCLLATILQLVSDVQMRRFRKTPENAGKNMEEGLWKFSRHPNYLGELSFWWGIWLIQISVLPAKWYTLFAPMAMTALFVFISIPMMEKRLLVSKEGYTNYKQKTSMLILLPKKK